MFESLWIERYRPKKLADIILEPAVRNVIEGFRDKKEIPSLLFSGNAGGGKTSLAKIIATDLLDCQYLYINASDENGIDTIRTKVSSFAQTRSIDGKLKIIILDEADGLTPDAQRSLRNVMEEYAEIVRFIFTCNFKHRIINPIQSRCQVFDIVPPLVGCVEYIKKILAAEKVNVPAEQKGKLIELIQRNYPDMRAVISNLQKNISQGTLNIVFLNNAHKFADSVLELVLKQNDPTEVRKFLIENESEFNKDFPNLLRSLFNAVDRSNYSVDQKRKYLLVLHEGLYRSTFVMDQEINAYATLISLTEN